MVFLFFVIRRGGHLSKTLLILALSPLASLPRRGSLVTVALRLRAAFLFSDRRCRGVGKWSMSFEGYSVGPASAGGGGRAKALWMEFWRVALSRASGEGMGGRFVQASLINSHHLGAMGRSHRGATLILCRSCVQCAESVEARRARRYVKALRRGCLIGVCKVGFAHCNSLSSKK